MIFKTILLRGSAAIVRDDDLLILVANFRLPVDPSAVSLDKQGKAETAARSIRYFMIVGCDIFTLIWWCDLQLAARVLRSRCWMVPF